MYVEGIIINLWGWLRLCRWCSGLFIASVWYKFCKPYLAIMLDLGGSCERFLSCITSIPRSALFSISAQVFIRWASVFHK